MQEMIAMPSLNVVVTVLLICFDRAQNPRYIYIARVFDVSSPPSSFVVVWLMFVPFARTSSETSSDDDRNLVRVIELGSKTPVKTM